MGFGLQVTEKEREREENQPNVNYFKQEGMHSISRLRLHFHTFMILLTLASALFWFCASVCRLTPPIISKCLPLAMGAMPFFMFILRGKKIKQPLQQPWKKVFVFSLTGISLSYMPPSVYLHGMRLCKVILWRLKWLVQHYERESQKKEKNTHLYIRLSRSIFSICLL